MHRTQIYTDWQSAMWPYTYTTSYPGLPRVFQLMPKINTGRPGYEAVKVHGHMTVSDCHSKFVYDVLLKLSHIILHTSSQLAGSVCKYINTH